MLDLVHTFKVGDVEYSLYFDHEAYIALERRHQLPLGRVFEKLNLLSAVASEACLLEGLEGFRRTFEPQKEPWTLVQAGRICFEFGQAEISPVLAAALAKTFSAKKGSDSGKAPAPGPTS